ncbi:hypothetical protein MKSMC1_29280 [Mycobacterium kansasii]|nr:hypothetical protein MKSMC1_29280 [Mycobacterium kansasii]
MTGGLLSASWDPGDAGLADVWLHEGFEVEYRLAGLLARSGDRAWTWKEFQTAWSIVRHWSDSAITPALTA